MSLAAERIRGDRVAVYIRWSTEDQGEGTTLDVQRDACQQFVLSQGWQFRDDLIFVDDGVSGASLDRPALKRLRALIRRAEVDCVVVYKLDRLSRSVLDMLKLVMEEWDDRCAVKSAREPIDTLSATGKMFFYQLMSFAEWERSVIRDRMFSGRLRRAQEGKSPGFVMPFGYRKEPGGPIEQDPLTAPVVRHIFQLYLSGMGCRLVARTLDEERLPTPASAPWTEKAIMRILSNPAYMGRLVFGRTRRLKGKVVTAKEPHVVREDVFPAIVSRDVWEAVQRLRSERPAPGRAEPAGGRSLTSDHLLTGLLRCTCGRTVTGVGFAVRGTVYRYYLCSGAQSTGRHLCPSGNIRQADLDRVVVDKLLAFFRGSEARTRLKAQLGVEVQAAHARAVTALEAGQQEVRRLEESERRLKRLLIDESLTVTEYRGLQCELSAQLAAARDAFRCAVQAEEAARDALGRDTQTALLLDRIDEWEALRITERKQLLRLFIDRITVFRDKQSGVITCEIEWKWVPDDAGTATREELSQERDSSRIRQFVRTRQRMADGRFAPVG